MSGTKFYKDLLDPGGNEDSDISEIGPGDMENMLKGVDDMDDALFGFKTKQQDNQKTKRLSDEPRDETEHSKPLNNKLTNVSDFPEGDLLADISLSDDDFFDLGKKSPHMAKNRDNIQTSTLDKTNPDKLTKTKKIANLFGLDDEDDVVADSKQKQQGAADWLGIKDSPVKIAVPQPEDKLETQNRKKSLTDVIGSDTPLEVKLPIERKKSNPLDVKTSLAKNFSSIETDLGTIVQKPKSDLKKTEPLRTRAVKSGEIFDLLGDKQESKASEQKEKKSAIFDELFGDTSGVQASISRRNSVVKTGEVISTGATAPVVSDNSEVVGQYTPSSGANRRPGLGRRREPNTPPAPLLFQDDWLSSNQQEVKKSISQLPKSEVKKSVVEVHDSLPTWLGGPGVSLEPKPQVPPVQENVQEKPQQITATDKPIPVESEKRPKADPVQVTDSVGEMLAISSEHSRQTALALQRTEEQLLAAVQLQTTQSSLAAVCARQRNLLDSQERQLAQLVAKQADRQGQMEKQLVEQQERIGHLLEVLSTSVMPAMVDPHAQSRPVKDLETETQQTKQVINDLKVELQKVTLENEELRSRIKLMEKHYNMEFESLQVQHRREIECWEDQLTKQKELSQQLSDDFKERIARLKENEAELIGQHKERVLRLREEQTEDMRQLMQFQKMTLEQLALCNKLQVSPQRIGEERPATQTWKHLDDNEITEKEEELQRKEKLLSGLQDKLETQREASEKRLEDIEGRLEQEKMKNDEISRLLKQEQSQIKYKQQQLNQEKKHMEEQYYIQRKNLEETQEKLMSEHTQLATEKLKLAEEGAKLEALAKLQGVSGTSSFDVLQAKAEVHGALEAARAAETQAVEDRRRLREKERALDSQRWKLREMEEDLVARAEHLDRLMQVSEANQEAGHKALEQAKQVEQRAEEKLAEVERRRKEVLEKEQSLIRLKLEIAQEEMRVNRKRQQLEHILPQLSSEEALSLQPIKDVIDPKILIMKLKAERELEAIVKP